MDIDKFASGYCDFCDYKNSKPCLSCMKIIIYEAIKHGIENGFFSADIDEAIRKGTIEALACNSYMAVEDGIKKAFKK